MLSNNDYQTNQVNRKIIRLLDDPSHVDLVSGWLFDKWGKNKNGESRENIARSLLAVDIPPTLVTLVRQKPIAVLSYRFFHWPQRAGQSLWVDALYVHCDWRGKGVGANLLHYGIDAANKAGYSTLLVYTDVSSFYERHGWTLCEFNEQTRMSILEYRNCK